MTRPENAAAGLLGQFFTDDDLRAGFADGGTIEVCAPAPESLCRTCTAPITLLHGVWAADSGALTCRTGRRHEPVGGDAA